jgi:hypothetical protein
MCRTHFYPDLRLDYKVATQKLNNFLTYTCVRDFQRSYADCMPTKSLKSCSKRPFPEHRAPRIRKKSPDLCSSIESPFGHRTRGERRLGMESNRRSPGYRFPADRCQRLQASMLSVRPRIPGPATPHWSCKLFLQISLASTRQPGIPHPHSHPFHLNHEMRRFP